MPTITLTWNAVTTNVDGTPTTDVAGYEVFRALASAPMQLLASPGNVTTYIDSNVPEVSQDVSYQVRAFDVVGNRGPFSTVAMVTVDVNPPAAPTGLSAVLS